MHRNIGRYNKYSNKLVYDTGNQYQTSGKRLSDTG